MEGWGAGMGEHAEEWLTTREALAALGIGRTRLWQLARAGRLTAYRRGANRRARYYRRDEVERLRGEYRSVPERQPGQGQEG